jgi:hypothetical protein
MPPSVFFIPLFSDYTLVPAGSSYKAHGTDYYKKAVEGLNNQQIDKLAKALNLGIPTGQLFPEREYGEVLELLYEGRGYSTLSLSRAATAADMSRSTRAGPAGAPYETVPG